MAGPASGPAPSGGRVWAGRAADPFYLDLSLLGDVDAVVQKGKDLPLAERRAQDTVNTFAGSTVQSIVLEVPHTDEILRSGRQVAVWCAAKLATDDGGWQQVNRQGLPMIWPIFRDAGSDEASTANGTRPRCRLGRLQERARQPRVRGRHAAGHDARSERPRGSRRGPPAARRPALPARDAGPVQLRDLQRPPLAVNAPEVMFSLVLGAAVPTGLRMAQAAETRSDDFPYVVPHTG